MYTARDHISSTILPLPAVAWTGVPVILIVFSIRSCIWYEFCSLTFPSWVLISRMDGVVCCNARCWHRGTFPSVYCCVELRCSRFRLHAPQSLDTPVGLDRDKVSKWQPVSPCGHMVIYIEFTLLKCYTTLLNQVLNRYRRHKTIF